MFAGKDFVASTDRSGFTGLRQKTLLLPSTEPVVQGCMTTLHERFTCSRLYSLPCEQRSSVSRYFSTRNHGFGSIFCARWQIFCCFHEQELFFTGLRQRLCCFGPQHRSYWVASEKSMQSSVFFVLRASPQGFQIFSYILSQISSR